jgi:hypothetical protein
MRRLLTLIAVACTIGAVLGPAASVAGAAGSAAVADCNSHGHLTRQYSAAQLRTALSTMPADVKEYTDCYDVIQRTLLASLAGTNHGGGGGSDQGSSGSFLPTPLVVVLVLLALAGATFAAVAIRRRGGADSSSSGS